MARANFIDGWLAGKQPNPKLVNFWVFSEQANTRKVAIPAVCEAVKEHLVGLNIIEKMGGYKKAAAVIKNRLPTGKKIRSGDLGEILATEYVQQKTTYRIPIRRLRYKDDRQMAMRGDDVIAIRQGKNKTTQVLKVEAKSRAALATTTVEEASEALLKNSSRPNPNTLAFISMRLRELNRHNEALLIERLQQHEVKQQDVEHLLFTFSGNNPANVLGPHATSPNKEVQRHLVGIVVSDHQAFIKLVFESIA
jgi:hypothetical protein